MAYRALVGLTNDKTGKSYKAGALLPATAFPPEVLKHWAKGGQVEIVSGTADAAAAAEGEGADGGEE